MARRRPGPSTPEPQLALAIEGDGEDTWTVSQLAGAIELAVTERFPDQLWLRGEIHNLRDRSRSPHTYFELVEQHADNHQPTAAVNITLLANDRDWVMHQLAETGGLELANGVEVRIRGRVEYRAQRSQIQVRMDAIDPMFTIGLLGHRRDQLRRTLDGEGLLRRQRQLIPAEVPLRVGLVTSADSAAAADVLRTLDASGFAFEVSVCDTRVQGPQAPTGICAGLTTVERLGVDVVLLVRGGGSMTDLLAFDDERVARAIATCRVPVITGVGHEIDTTIADEVAFSPANTPTGAAELVVRRVQRFADRVTVATTGITAVADRSLSRHRHHLDAVAQRTVRASHLTTRAAMTRLETATVRLSPPRLRRVLGDQTNRVERVSSRIDAVVRRHLADHRRRLDDAGRRMAVAAERTVVTQRRRLDALDHQHRLLDPATALARGWSITTDVDGIVVRDPTQVSPGQRLTTRVAGGTISSTVDDDSHEDPA